MQKLNKNNYYLVRNIYLFDSDIRLGWRYWIMSSWVWIMSSWSW